MVRALLAGVILCAPLAAFAQPSVVFQVDAENVVGATSRTFASGTDDVFTWNDRIYNGTSLPTGTSYMEQSLNISASNGMVTINRNMLNNYAHVLLAPNLSQSGTSSFTVRAFVRGGPGTPYIVNVNTESYQQNSNPFGTGSTTLTEQDTAGSQYSFGPGRNRYFLQGVSGGNTVTFMSETYSEIPINLDSDGSSSFTINEGTLAPFTAINRLFGRTTFSVKNLNFDPVGIKVSRIDDRNPDAPNLVVVPEIDLNQITVDTPNGPIVFNANFPANTGRRLQIPVASFAAGVHDITVQGTNGSISTTDTVLGLDTSAFNFSDSLAVQPNGNAGSNFSVAVSGFRRQWTGAPSTYDRRVDSYSSSLTTFFPFGGQAMTSAVDGTFNGTFTGSSNFSNNGALSNNLGFNRWNYSQTFSSPMRFVKSGASIDFAVRGTANTFPWVFQPSGLSTDGLTITIN